MNPKEIAALKALDFVENGMTLGLGSGSTSSLFINFLGERIQHGKLQDIKGVPTSKTSQDLALQNGIQLVTLTESDVLDLAIDGADEVDPRLDLIKGMGGALLREKIVAINSRKFIIIVDKTKLVPKLGSKSPLPVEIIPFEFEMHLRWLSTLGCQVRLLENDKVQPFLTDNGNYLALCSFSNGISKPGILADILNSRPGIIEHGLFLNIASSVIVANHSGVRILERNK